MKIQVLSDLHLGSAPFDVPKTDAELVVLAGDVARPAKAIEWAKAFDKPVLYVPGNHEFYGSSLKETVAELERLSQGSQIHIFANKTFVKGTVRFLGTTLWTDFNSAIGFELDEVVAKSIEAIRDFSHIRYQETEDAPEVVFHPQHAMQEFAQNVAWLKHELAQPFTGKTVVISHHAPSLLSIHPRFSGSIYNANFTSDLEELMGEGIDLWIHGHMHDSFDYSINGTRILCNPRGYHFKAAPENLNFNPKLVVEL